MEVCPTNALMRTEYDTSICRRTSATVAGTASRRARTASSDSTRAGVAQSAPCYDRCRAATACVREGMPDGVDQFGYTRISTRPPTIVSRICRSRATPRRSSMGATRRCTVPQRVLPADGQARDLQAAQRENGRSEPQQPPRIRGWCRDCRCRAHRRTARFRNGRMNGNNNHNTTPPPSWCRQLSISPQPRDGSGGFWGTSSAVASPVAATRSARCCASLAIHVTVLPRSSHTSQASSRFSRARSS